MANKHLPHDLKQMQSLPLEAKIRMSEQRIKVWFESWTRFEIYNEVTGKTRFATIDTRGFGTEPPLKENERIESAVDGQVYVSFSGGKDSTVLADLCARVCREYGWTLYLLFVNTGLEYPEIQKFVKVYAEWLRNTYKIEVVLSIVRPEMRFDEVVKKYGYPLISKAVAHAVKIARRNPSGKVMQNLFNPENKGRFGFYKWTFLIDSEIPISEECCNVMKKTPAKKYTKETGRKPLLGTLANESSLRYSSWLKKGCNAFDGKNPSSQPLSFWTEQDILHYIKKYNVPYCSVYGDIQIKAKKGFEEQVNMIDFLDCYETEDILETTGCDRTGCIFCMFGCHLEKEPNRFQRLKQTHPKQYEYCIGGGEMVDGKWQPNKEGLGLGKVLDYIGVKYD